MAGMTQSTMMALASMIGVRSLGLELLLALGRIEEGRRFEAGLSIVYLAIIIDHITHAMTTRQRK